MQKQQSPGEIRRARGLSQMRVAVEAKVSIPTVRLFELAGPNGVADARKRENLSRLYASLADNGGQPPRAA